MNNTSLKIAVIGSGAAGLTAAHLLQRSHRVTLFEKDSRLGGHTHTVRIPDGPDAGTPVDTGFIVMNHRNYPTLTLLFEQLGVELRDAEMSFGYYDRPTGLQYCGSGLDGLFAQRRNLFRPSFIHMVRETLRFFKTAQADLNRPELAYIKLGSYLEQNHFGEAFIRHHLIPMGSAIWSTPCEDMLAFPALNFLQFFNNHGLLSLTDRPQWKTVVGGSCDYIRRMQKTWTAVEVLLNQSLQGIRRTADAVDVLLEDGTPRPFDHVVLATHADQALRLLTDPTPEERLALLPWRYAKSRTILHTDCEVMPPLKKVWSAWNFQRIQGERTCLTYDMNRLQKLNTEANYFVSLDLPSEPRGMIGEFYYEHPMFTGDALAARDRLTALNGKTKTWFAGSYFGNGFHEDAVQSGADVAKHLGVAL